MRLVIPPSLFLMLAVGSLLAAIASAQVVAARTATIEWVGPTSPGNATTVRVVGLPQVMAQSMASAPPTDPRWSLILAVHLVHDDGTIPVGRPAVAGKYRIVDGSNLMFTPLFALDAARIYRATLSVDGPAGRLPVLSVDRVAVSRPTTPTTTVRTIEPTADRLPANVLRFYVSFSAPMGRGEAYAHLKLVDAAGQTLDHPFLELGEELWDPTGTRLTVLLDPGRVKRGLRPHEELGPIFSPGRSYTFKIDPTWRDATGLPLATPASKTFTTGPTDETSPTPATWTLSAPSAGSRSSLLVTFHDTLDRATVASGLTLLDPNGQEVSGAASAQADGSGWMFLPTDPWTIGSYQLMVNPDLEDLAGNSIRRPFEVDIQRDVPIVPDVSQIRLPIFVTP